MLAYRKSEGGIQSYEWLCNLSEAVIRNVWVNDKMLGEIEAPTGAFGYHQNLVNCEHHFKCSKCELHTHYKCGCGVKSIKIQPF
jgi:hypothetical protein